MSAAISVIVPVYNSEKSILRCAESILKQTFQDFELLLVDDGSTDSSLHCINLISEKDNRVRILEKSNGGVSSARNLGLENAKGEFITFVDSDDWIEPDFLYKLFHSAKKYKSDLTMCGYTRVIGTAKQKKNPNINVANLSDRQIEELIMKNYVYKTSKLNGINSVWNKIYRKSLIGSLRFDEKRKNGEDWWFNLHIFEKVQKMSIVDENLYYYNLTSNDFSLSKTFSVNKINDLVYFYQPYVDLLSQYNIPKIDIATERIKDMLGEISNARVVLPNDLFKKYIEKLGHNEGLKSIFSEKTKLKGIERSLAENIEKKEVFIFLINIYALDKKTKRALKNIIKRVIKK